MNGDNGVLLHREFRILKCGLPWGAAIVRKSITLFAGMPAYCDPMAIIIFIQIQFNGIVAGGTSPNSIVWLGMRREF